MGILAFICTQFPDTKLSLIFLPQFTFSAGAVSQNVKMVVSNANCPLS